MTNTVHVFQRAEKRGGKAQVETVAMDDTDTLKRVICDDELYLKLIDDAELLNELVNPLDMTRVMRGEQSPLFFGSAMSNFGVQLFLDKFCEMGTKPLGRIAVNQVTLEEDGEQVLPEFEEFTGFIFKTQANLDPKHRDRLAYVRIVSGMFEKGMKVGHSRSKPGKKYNLGQAQALFGSDRSAIETAYPGDGELCDTAI
jgi:peptide chain release factor 3